VRRELNIAQQDGNQDLAEANASDAQRHVQAELITTLAHLDAARPRIEVTRIRDPVATQALRVPADGYRPGCATSARVRTRIDGPRCCCRAFPRRGCIISAALAAMSARPISQSTRIGPLAPAYAAPA